jgi:hypothetical protein
MAEIENLNARRALQTNDNRKLSLDELVDILKNDPEAADATKFVIVAIEPYPDGGIKSLNYYMANMSRTEIIAASAIVHHRSMQQ